MFAIRSQVQLSSEPSFHQIGRKPPFLMFKKKETVGQELPWLSEQYLHITFSLGVSILISDLLWSLSRRKNLCVQGLSISCMLYMLYFLSPLRPSSISHVSSASTFIYTVSFLFVFWHSGASHIVKTTPTHPLPLLLGIVLSIPFSLDP